VFYFLSYSQFHTMWLTFEVIHRHYVEPELQNDKSTVKT